MGFVRAAVVILGALAILVTALPLVRSNEWWIRMWDFPRVQVAIVIGLTLLAVPVWLKTSRRGAFAFAAMLGVALAYQLARIWPFTPLHAPEVAVVDKCDAGSSIRLLTANVLMSNRNAEPILDHIRRLDPDVVLLVETDAWWDKRLADMKRRYPYEISYPRENYYGLHLFSRFELVDPEIRFLIDEYVPSLRSGIRLPSGALINFHGIHSKPPPQHDTARRDAELLLTARDVRDTVPPSIVAGDLNDVAWSRTTRLFRKYGGLLDPRIGRGVYPTFNANWPLLRWPLDHVFFERDFSLQELRVLGPVGSDHFPVFAVLCHAPHLPNSHPIPRPDGADIKSVREAIKEGREEARENR